MSKITNDGLTLSCTGCFLAATHMTTVGVKRLTHLYTAHQKNVSITSLLTAQNGSSLAVPRSTGRIGTFTG